MYELKAQDATSEYLEHLAYLAEVKRISNLEDCPICHDGKIEDGVCLDCALWNAA